MCFSDREVEGERERERERERGGGREGERERERERERGEGTKNVMSTSFIVISIDLIVVNLKMMNAIFHNDNDVKFIFENLSIIHINVRLSTKVPF